MGHVAFVFVQLFLSIAGANIRQFFEMTKTFSKYFYNFMYLIVFQKNRQILTISISGEWFVGSRIFVFLYLQQDKHMLQKTKGIIIHAVKYSDAAWVVTAYTEGFGREAYMVYGVNKKKSTFRAAYLQPLTLVEMNVEHIPGKELQRIKDIQIDTPVSDIPANPVKNAIALFLSEILFKTLRLSEPDEQLYAYLENSIQLLEHSKKGIANFHLLFLMKLTRYLGFEPNSENTDRTCFDLMNGVFLSEKPLHAHYLLHDDAQYFGKLMSTPFTAIENLMLDRQRRNRIISQLMDYYRLHISGFSGVNSVEILHELFD